MTQFIKNEFKESTAAKKFSCRKKKAAAIRNCLG